MKIFTKWIYIILSGVLLTACSKNEERDKMVESYNQGLTLFEKEYYIDAIKTLEEAEQIANSLDEDFYAGLICSAMHNVYDATNERKMALVYAYNAYQHFLKTDSTTYINNAYLNMGIAYYKIKSFDESHEIFDKTYHIAHKSNNTELLNRCLEYYIQILYFHDFYSGKSHGKIRELLKEFTPQSGTGNAILAYMYALDNKPDSVNIILTRADSLENEYNTTDEFSKLYIEAQIYALQKDSAKAYKIMEECYRRVEWDRTLQARNSVVTAQKRFADTQAMIQRHVAKERQQKHIAIIISLFAILFALIAYIISFRRRKRAEQYKYTLLIEDLTKKENSSNLLLKEKTELIKDLYRAQFKDITELATDFYSYNANPKIIYNKTKDIIDKLVNDNQSTAKLEEIINLYHNNIVEHLRNSVDGITDNDCRIFCYYCSGFSPQVISLLTKNKIENIYTQKYRLKQKIAGSCSTRKEEILELIN